MARTSIARESVKVGLLLFVLAFAFFPFYLMVVISFKNNDQFTSNPFLPDSPSQWHWENWRSAASIVSTYAANSILTAFFAVACCLVMATLTSYVIARYRFPGRNVVYYGLLATMFLPGTAATLVTLFTLISSISLYNSLFAIILVGAIAGQAVCVFILRQFIEDIPKELFECAQLDGAGHLQQIRHIVLPMSGSVLSTLAIMQFIGCWNELLLWLVVIKDQQLMNIPAGLMRLDGAYVKEWGKLMAGYTISSIPLLIVFLFTMRLFVRGLSAGAVKG